MHACSLGAFLPRERPRRRRVLVRGTLLLLCRALRKRARPLARATPATYEDVPGGARTASGVERRASALGAGSVWRAHGSRADATLAQSLFIAKVAQLETQINGAVEK